MNLIWWIKCWILCFFVLPHFLYSTNAQSYDAYDYPSANISTSWMINSSNGFDYFSGGSMESAILVKTTSSTIQFRCGFVCNGTCDSFLFAILIVSTMDPSIPQIVWSANRNHPVRKKATLQLTSVGDLVLKDVDGSIVWSTNTSGKSVAGLNLTDTGNLLLFDDKNATVWQSFDHPTDCLLLGQKLMEGKKLTPSVSPTNWTEMGLLSLSVTEEGLFASVESNPPQAYYQLVGYGSKTNNEPTFVRFLNGSLALFWNSSEPDDQIYMDSRAQYMRFGSDGHLRVYAWNASWTEVGDVLSGYTGDCSYPTVCGSYGICYNDGQCSCPPQAIDGKNYFEPLNYKQPNLGCRENTPLSCEASQYQTFLELSGTSYFSLSMSADFNFVSFIYNELCNGGFASESCKLNVTSESCKLLCSKNCSCKAVIFQYDSDPAATGKCYMLSTIVSFVNNERGDLNGSTVYVKVQNISNIHNQNISNTHNVPITVPRKKESRQMPLPMILGSSIGSFIGLFILIGILLLLIWKKGEADEVEEDYLDQVPGMLTRFSFEDLKAMTGNFCKVLGEGGFGSVFEGTLADGTKVAVKQLDSIGQVKKSFLTEVEAVGSIHHVNLVRLLGYCAEKFHRLLVYECMSNGSLDKWIFHKSCELVLDWQQRKKIIVDIAKGLAYLHEDCRQKIIHLDIKPQNILLDDHFNAKISDFGLSKLIDRDQSKVMTTMRGTPGYLAPEWLSSVITEKVDIYSFGVVILEIICQRRNFDRSQPEEQMHLLSHFEKMAKENRLLELVDDSQNHEAEILKNLKVAAWCLQSDYAKRPCMSVVVNVLEGVIEVENNIEYYNLLNPTFTRMLPEGTPLLPSILSGPR